jgi:hypothetical protein
MPGHHRSKSKEDSTGVLTFRQKSWGGGENSDLPASVIAEDEVPLLQDLVAFPGYLEGHSGSERYSATALPGSGTVHAWRQHPVSKKWLLHRGAQLWTADAAMTTWTEVTSYGQANNVTVNGDAGSQLAGTVTLRNVNASNTNAGTTYWNLTNSGTTRTVSIYKDLAKTQLVAQGSRVGNGTLYAAQQNASGLSAQIPVTYTGDDTDAANTFVASALSYPFLHDVNSTIRDFDNHFVIAPRGFNAYLVNLTDGKFQHLSYAIGSGYGRTPLVGTGTQSVGTPYGYRFIYTYCRIVDSSGVPAYGASRVTGSLVNESAANAFLDSAGTDFMVDYAEYWVANPISDANPLSIDTGGRLFEASEHWTHGGLYRVLDIGTNGIDPVSGAGNNREIYIWCGDFDITTNTWSITKTDDELRSMYAAGFGLRTRGWRELPVGEVLEVTPNFLYLGTRGDNKVPYCQLGAKELAGYYHPGFQVLKLDSSLQAIAKSSNMVTFICNNKCWRSSPSVYKNVGAVGQAIFQLRHLVPVDGPIGVTDWSSITEVETGTFIAHCSDHTIRTWDGLSWSKDLASRKVRKKIRTIMDGSAGGYFAGAFLLWYRDSSASTYNTKCLRYGFGGDAGDGWSRLVRSSWVFPPLYAGAAQCIDANGVTRLLALDSVDERFYWVETFDSHTGSGLAKAWKDKIGATAGTDITPAVLLRERVGSKESNTLRHQETHLQLRPVEDNADYLTGFQVSISGYADGNSTAIETVSDVPKTGDISFWKEHKGHRLQTGLSFTTSKFRLVSIESRDLEDDRKILGQGPFDTTEAGYQRTLGATLTHWLTRFSPRLNRARGALYTLVSGAAPSLVTGPDGRSFALSFVDGIYQQSDTTLYSDFSFGFWAKGVTNNKRVFSTVGSAFFHVQFQSDTSILITDTALGFVVIPISSIAAGWHHFWVIRLGTTLYVYQNGVLISSTAGWVTPTIGGTAFQVNPEAAAMQIYDLRALTTALTSGPITYYAGDVLNNAGGKVLP